MRRAGLVAVLLLVASPAGAVSPWRAAERLPLTADGHAPAGLSAAIGLRRIEAAADEGETVVAAGFEPSGGIGGRATWRRVALDDGGAMTATRADLVLRRGPLRLRAGMERWAFAGRRRDAVRLGASRAFAGRVLVSGGCELFPGEVAGSDRVETAVLVGDGLWWGSFRAGPEPGELTAGAGLFLDRGIAVDLTVAGDAPAVGVSWRWGAWELRVRGREHPVLGSTAEVAFICGGGDA